MSDRAWWLFGALALLLVGVAFMFKGTPSLLAQAIAAAEGFGTPGAIPTVRNNPGDLKLGSDDSITTFATLSDGWAALMHQLGLISSGASAYYNRDMSIADFAVTYTGNDNAPGWSATVVQFLNSHGYSGVTTDSPISTFL